MENGQFRHVSAGALILAACALLAACVGAVSVVASEIGHDTEKAGVLQTVRIQDKLSGKGRVFVPALL